MTPVASTILGITAQVDLGNALVGVGGLALAWATICATRSSTKISQQNLEKQANARIAEFRVNWISVFRDNISEYIRYHRNIELARSKSQTGKVPVNDRDRLLELLAVRVKIQTMLKENPNEQAEKDLLDLLSKDVPQDGDAAKRDRVLLVNLTRSVLKAEWAKVKSEIRN